MTSSSISPAGPVISSARTFRRAPGGSSSRWGISRPTCGARQSTAGASATVAEQVNDALSGVRPLIGEGTHPASRGSRLRGVRSVRRNSSSVRGPPRHLQRIMPTLSGQGPKVPVPGDLGQRGLPGTAGSVADLRLLIWDLRPWESHRRDWLTLSVFTGDEVELALEFPAAVSRLALLLRGDWLDSVSQDAYAEGLTGQVRVGPLGGVPGVSKRVE